MPSLAELLKLPTDAYQRILAMPLPELKEYLKDITSLEPIGVVTSVLDVEIDDDETVSKPRKAKVKKTSKQKLLDAEFENAIASLKEMSEEDKKKLTEGM